MQPKLIAFTGHYGSGKTLQAKILAERLGASGYSFAHEVRKRADQYVCGLYLWPSWMPAEIVNEWPHFSDRKDAAVAAKELWAKPTTPRARRLLQATGDLTRKYVDEAYWLKAMHIGPRCPAVIDDLRYPNEATYVAALGGVILRLHRTADRDPAVLAHPSEASVPFLPAIDIPEGTPEEVAAWVAEALGLA